MSKYSVGVGDAFPVDGAEKRSPEPEIERGADRDDDRWRRHRRHYRQWRSSFLFEATLILLAIYGVLHFVNGYAPRGLLVAAGITFAVGVVRRLFWRSHWSRHEWRLERRRRWEDR